MSIYISPCSHVQRIYLLILKLVLAKFYDTACVGGDSVWGLDSRTFSKISFCTLSLSILNIKNIIKHHVNKKLKFLWVNYNKNLVCYRRQERNWVLKITSLLHRFWRQFDDDFLSQWKALCLTHGGQRGHQIPCNCIYRWLWADIWVLGTEWRHQVFLTAEPCFQSQLLQFLNLVPTNISVKIIIEF